jgi:surface protein
MFKLPPLYKLYTNGEQARMSVASGTTTKRPNSNTLPFYLESLPDDILKLVLAQTAGMSCYSIKELCKVSSKFVDMCRIEQFWEWQCKLHKWDIPERIKFARYLLKVDDNASITWNMMFDFWCKRIHTNASLRANVTSYLIRTGFGKDIFSMDEDLYDGMPGFNTFNTFYGPIEFWDTSEVTNMSGLFEDAVFNTDISLWDTSNVLTMQDMFKGTKDFNQDLSAWNTSKVNNMSEMFAYCRAFEGVGLTHWDVSNVTSMDRMFISATNFNSDLSVWDIQNVKTMEKMFEYAQSFNYALDRWFQINFEVNTFSMFTGAIMYPGNRPSNSYVSQILGRW